MLFYKPNFIENDIATILFDSISHQERIKIQYGLGYIRGKIIQCEPFPTLIYNIAQKIDPNINNCVVNVYPPKTCIGMHIDDINLGPVIYGLSLGSATTFELQNPRSSEKVLYLLEPNSLYILEDEYRYDWCHKTRPDNINTRISITFRNIKI
jgi:alkylated DNA repair dioxygenase AlkB